MITTLQTIVLALQSDPTIDSILGDNIFIGEPLDELDGMTLAINIISQIQNVAINNRTLIELRYKGDDLIQLGDIETLVTAYIRNNLLSLGLYNMEINQLVNGYNEKKKPIYIRDITLYMITDYN